MAADDGRSTLVACDDVHVTFQGRRGAAVRALRGVSLQVGVGERVGVIGESGSGKSTLARVLMGLQAPTSGSVRVGERTSRNRGRRARVARARHMQMVFQSSSAALDPQMTVRSSLLEPLRFQRGRGDGPDAVAAALSAVGLDLEEHGSRRPVELSGGQRQRVCIARALTLQPDLLICDEVVSALDVSTQADVLTLLDDLQRTRGLGLLFISHDLAVVSQISDRLIVMFAGRIVEQGRTDVLLGSPQHPYTAELLAAQPDPFRRARPAVSELLASVDSAGCAYRPRCSYSDAQCGTREPELRSATAGVDVRCHHADALELATDPLVAPQRDAAPEARELGRRE